MNEPLRTTTAQRFIHHSTKRGIPMTTESTEHDLYIARENTRGGKLIGTSVRLNTTGETPIGDERCTELIRTIRRELNVEGTWEYRGDALYFIIFKVRMADMELWRKVRDILSRELNAPVNLITMERALQLIDELGIRNLTLACETVQVSLTDRNRRSTAAPMPQ